MLKEDRFRLLIEEQRSSGLSIKEFCSKVQKYPFYQVGPSFSLGYSDIRGMLGEATPPGFVAIVPLAD